MALSLIGVAASLVEIFVVCMQSLRVLFATPFDLLSRCFPSGLSATTGLAVIYLSFMWRRLECSFGIYVGNGLGIDTVKQEASFSHPSRSPLTCYSRSHAFYYIFSAFYVAELLASYIASVTIDISPWIPSGLAMASVILCLLLLWLMPRPNLDAEANATRPLATAREETAGILSVSRKDHSVRNLLSTFSNTKVLLTIPVFLVGIFRYTTLNVLIQYASIRFQLSISTGAMFYTETALINIFLFLFMVPRLTAYVRRRYNVQPQIIDLFLVRTSVILMCCGSLAIGLAWSGNVLPAGTSPPLLSVALCCSMLIF
jgi:hypothetical protein